MSYNPGWCNARTMANQGCAPAVTKIYHQIISDPFSQAFFLSTLYAAEESKLKVSHPHYFGPGITHEAARLRVELILVNMYLHILRIKRCGLQSLKMEVQS